MDQLEHAKLLAALLGVLKKESSKVKSALLEELHTELQKFEPPEPILVEGPRGEQGERGFPGERGLDGDQGPQGLPGNKGEQGEQGLPGKSIIEAQLNESGHLFLYRDDGVQFPIGNVIGEQGVPGEQGIPGEKGDKGDKGDRGEQGPRGEIGPKGDRGLPGYKGERGEKGEKGNPGERGLPGEKGDKGDTGSIGPRGDRGEKGETGIQGIPGPQGEKGDPGPKGEKGDPGKDGDSPDIEPYLKKVSEETKKFQDNIRRTITRASIGGSSSGGGEVRLEFLDDVDRNSVKQNGKVLRYNSSTGRFEGATVLTEGGAGSGDVANTYLQANFVSNTLFQSFVANTNPRFNQYLQVANNKTILAGNNIVLSQNATSITIASTASGGGSGDVSNTYIQATFVSNTNFQSYVSNTNTRLNSLEAGGGSGVNLAAVATNIVPAANNTYDLGTTEKRWKDLFLSGQTINLGGATISSDGTGTVQISGQGAVLPANSKVTISGRQQKLATVSEEGVVEQLVPLFTQATGFTAPANTFIMKGDTTTRVFTDFTLNSGDQLTRTAKQAQFLF